MNKLLTILTSIVVLFTACTKNGQETTRTEDQRLDLSGLEFTEISKRLITDVVECTGIIDVPPNERAAMYAPIGGNITDIKVLPGDLVKKGQVLYRLSHQDIIAIQQDFLVAFNDEKLQKTNLDRKEQLFQANNISERELRQVRRDYNVARANLESLAAQIQLIGLAPQTLVQDGIRTSISVRAPISGYISKIEAVSGSYVNMNSRIMTIVNADHMHLELNVYADRISQVVEGQRVGFRIAGDDREHWGEVYLVGKEVDEETRTVAVHAHMLHEEQLVVGSYLYAGILITTDSLWSLPVNAVVNADDKQFVVAREGETLQAIQIATGNSFKGYIAVHNHEALVNKQIIAKDAYYYFEE